MTAHLKAGGTLIIEPWFTPDNRQPDTVHATFIDEPGLKIARINTSRVKDNLFIFDLHYLIGTPKTTEHVVKRHELGLFEIEEIVVVMEKAGLLVNYETDRLTGRELYIATRMG